MNPHKPHLHTHLSEQDYARLKSALEASSSRFSVYPLGMSDREVIEFANRFDLASKPQKRPSTPANPPAPKPKFKKPRHPNARKGRR